MGHIGHKHIVVFGAGGQLGKEFQYLYEEEHFPGQYTFLIKEQCDITSANLVNQLINELKPNVVINCAAYTAVDNAEKEPALAELINSTAAANLASAAHSLQIPIIHFSTDYVYNGKDKKALTEGDLTDPSGVYATTKLAGEFNVQKANPNHLIFRTSWVYSMFGNNFVRTMLRLSQDRDTINVVNDQVGSPTWARDLARSVLSIIDSQPDLSKVAGTYNYSNQGSCSWYDFAVKIFEITGVNIQVNPIPSSDYPTLATRPFFSLLDKSKFIETFKLDIPQWEDSLEACLKEMI